MPGGAGLRGTQENGRARVSCRRQLRPRQQGGVGGLAGREYSRTLYTEESYADESKHPTERKGEGGEEVQAQTNPKEIFSTHRASKRRPQRLTPGLPPSPLDGFV